MNEVTRELVQQKINTLDTLNKIEAANIESLRRVLSRDLHPDLELEFEEEEEDG